MNMKYLLILMILLSLFVGVSTNIAFFTLYGSEFPGVISMINAGTFSKFDLIVWIILLISHLMVVTLPFLTKTTCFEKLLVIAPLSFILFYILLEGALFVLLLIPFINRMIICLVKYGRNKNTVAIIR
jgi:hypothetical protein